MHYHLFIYIYTHTENGTEKADTHDEAHTRPQTKYTYNIRYNIYNRMFDQRKLFLCEADPRNFESIFSQEGKVPVVERIRSI